VGASLGAAWLLLAGPLVSHASADDALESAITRASEASAREDWAQATAALEDAYDLLPGPSAQLEYDLGTAYAQVGELGYAYAHLRRAVELGLGTDALEAARRNQGIVRRRAEIAAAVNGTTLSAPRSWSARIEDLLARAWFGALALALGAAHLVCALIWVWARRSVVVLRAAATCALLGGVVLAVHVWAATRPAQAVILHDIELRAGPGDHREATVTLQASSVGAIVDENGRGVKVRIDERTTGWIPSSALARFPVGAAAVAEPPLPTRRTRSPVGRAG
jgi:tetratricopeptide (TPR) repeat protein